MQKRLKKKKISRRDFLGIFSACAAGATTLFSFFGLVHMIKPRVSPDVSRIFRIGKPSQFPPGTIKDLPEQKVRILATSEGVAALSLECTHLGCIIKDTGTEFKCPCHGSRFRKDGKVLGGPAPRPLKWFNISQAADGTLLVNSSKEVPAGQYYQV